MNKKIDFVAIICYIGIFILLILIAMPPILRATVVNVNESPQNEYPKVYLLKCSKFDDNLEEQKIINTYTDNKVTLIKWQFPQTIENLPDKELVPEKETTIIEEKPIVNLELSYDMLKGLNNISIADNDNKIILTASKSFLAANESIFLNYIKEISAQKQIYENFGYSCSIEDVEF